jgi:predicted SnoaL-like aldol condensation-catalyzing enzyme
MPALIDAAVIAAQHAPQRVVTVKRTIDDGVYVLIHSHVCPQPAALGMSVMHLFRFEDGQIAELWDVGQAVPADTPNLDGMF